jgi:nicotinate phosphoribosyltransferase
VRLDSGDLIALSKSVRDILDSGGLRDVTIFVSGGLDEDSLAAFARAGAPIDGIGIGTAMTTSSDVPAIDCVYKLQEYAGIARRKRSENKATWPGRKQVWPAIFWRSKVTQKPESHCCISSCKAAEDCSRRKLSMRSGRA